MDSCREAQGDTAVPSHAPAHDSSDAPPLQLTNSPPGHSIAPSTTTPRDNSPAALDERAHAEQGSLAATSPVATASTTSKAPQHAGAAGSGPASSAGGGASQAAAGGAALLRAATTVAGVAAAAGELRAALRGHLAGLHGELRRLQALNEALAERCGAQAEQAAAVATFAQVCVAASADAATPARLIFGSRRCSCAPASRGPVQVAECCVVPQTSL